MNKQRYLAELQRLLVFMTEEDRSAAVQRYAAMFDAAGEDGADALIAKIGSPTKVAIALSRGYEPGAFAAEPAAEPEKPEAARPSRRREEPSAREDVSWDELINYDMPDYMTEDEEDRPEEDPAEAPRPRRSGEGDEPLAWEEEPEPWRRPEAAAEKTRHMPLGLGIPLFILIILAVGVPLLLAAAAAMAALLLPGAAGGIAAYLAAVGGLWCVGYIADAVFMFGLGFILLGVGLLLLWAGIWVDAKIIGLYARGVQWLSGALLGKRVTEDA